MTGRRPGRAEQGRAGPDRTGDDRLNATARPSVHPKASLAGEASVVQSVGELHQVGSGRVRSGWPRLVVRDAMGSGARRGVRRGPRERHAWSAS